MSQWVRTLRSQDTLLHLIGEYLKVVRRNGVMFLQHPEKTAGSVFALARTVQEGEHFTMLARVARLLEEA
jgi:hypothetical protein